MDRLFVSFVLVQLLEQIRPALRLNPKIHCPACLPDHVASRNAKHFEKRAVDVDVPAFVPGADADSQGA